MDDIVEEPVCLKITAAFTVSVDRLHIQALYHYVRLSSPQDLHPMAIDSKFHHQGRHYRTPIILWIKSGFVIRSYMQIALSSWVIIPINTVFN